MNNRQTAEERPSVEPRWLFPLLDIILVFISFGLGYLLRYELQLIRPVFDPSRSDFLPYLPYAVVYCVILLFSYGGQGLYRNIRGRSWIEEVTIIVNGVAYAALVLLAMFFLIQPLVTSRLMLVYVAGLTVVLLSLSRFIRRLVLAYLRSRGIGTQRVLIIGMGETGQAVLRTIVSRSDLGYRPVGYLDDNPERGDVDLGRVQGLGQVDNMRQAIRDTNAEIVIITLKWKHYDRILELVRMCRQLDIEVRLVPDIFQLNMRQVIVENFDGIPLLSISGGRKLRLADRLLKRALDIALVIVGAVAWVPLLVMVAIAIKLDDGGPVFYRTRRMGENGKEFDMFKFRSMVVNADDLRDEVIKQAGQDPLRPKIINDPRITRVGRFIRATSLDELPNCFNVLMGQMSLVGPRPPRPDEVEHYEPWHMQRLGIIPGITGLWQVSGRSEIPFDEMCLMDIYYIENWSIKLDLQILLRTVPRVLLRDGAY